jgi:ParB/RepB/Spo0J family partition protein
MVDVYLKEIPLDSIMPDPTQPRNLAGLDELIEQVKSGDHHAKATWDTLLDLSTSILEVGLQQPIIVYPSGEPDRYIIYDGQRRWAAMTFLHRQGQGNGRILCYVRPTPKSDDDTLLGQLHTNIQREDFNVFELARSLQKVHSNLQANGGTVRLVRKDGGIETVEAKPGEPDKVIWDIIEKKMGIGHSRRYQIQAVLKFPPRIQRIAEKAALRESRLRFLIRIKDEQILETIISEIVERNLSNAQIGRRVKELQEEFASLPVAAMPKPIQIRSAIKPIRTLAREVDAVKNAPAAISAKDPRTVKSYRKLIPELRSTIRDLETILTKLEFLEAE